MSHRDSAPRGFEARLAAMPPCLISMEACVGAHDPSCFVAAEGSLSPALPTDDAAARMFKTGNGLLARFAQEGRPMPIMDDELDDVARADEMRCVAVIDTALAAGKAANAAAVMALTMGARHPHLVGQPLTDAAGNRHPGLIPIGIAVLGAPEAELATVRERARTIGLDVVDVPVQGQQTTHYTEFQKVVRAWLARIEPLIGLH